jgi:hypothetical protein
MEGGIGRGVASWTDGVPRGADGGAPVKKENRAVSRHALSVAAASTATAPTPSTAPTTAGDRDGRRDVRSSEDIETQDKDRCPILPL